MRKTKQRHKAEEETKVSGVRWLGEEQQKSFHRRARLHENRSKPKPVWNLKPLCEVVPFTWQFTWKFYCANFPNNSKTLLHMCKWYLLIIAKVINAKQMFHYWLFFKQVTWTFSHRSEILSRSEISNRSHVNVLESNSLLLVASSSPTADIYDLLRLTTLSNVAEIRQWHFLSRKDQESVVFVKEEFLH